MKRHRCKFYVSSWCGTKVTFRCVCGEQREREMTKVELCKFKHDHTFRPKPKDNIHLVWHDFMKKFMVDQSYRYKGYDLMTKVERWARKWPKEVRIVGCDDGYHANSSLVLIEHRTKSRYMGTSVVYIPQCTGESSTQFFLYPSDRGALIAALREVAREAAPRARRQRAVERERREWWERRARRGN